MNTFDCTDLQINPHNIKKWNRATTNLFTKLIVFLKIFKLEAIILGIHFTSLSGDMCDLAYIGATVLKFGPACMADGMTVQPKYKQKFKKVAGM